MEFCTGSDEGNEKKILRMGNRGEDVRRLQTMLAVCGYTGCSAQAKAADGFFGPVTFHNLKDGFQKAHENILPVCGEYGPRSRALLEEEYGSRLSDYPKKLELSAILKAADRFAAQVTGTFHYGDAPFLPIVNSEAKTVSCDRLVDSILYLLGFRDVGNTNVWALRDYLKGKGFEENTAYGAIRPGDVVFFSGHVFLVTRRDGELWDRYDGGSDKRLGQTQPFHEPIDPKQFVCSSHLLAEEE